MHPNDILNRIPKPGMCVDCAEPAILTDRKDPLCERHARALGAIPPDPGMDMATCSECSYSYNKVEWDRCPNDECIINAHTVSIYGHCPCGKDANPSGQCDDCTFGYDTDGYEPDEAE